MVTDTTGAKSLTAAQMKLKALYVGFDFDAVRYIDNTAGYPYPQLRCFADEPVEEPADAPVDEPTEQPVVCYLGDVDGDEDVTVPDATCIMRYNAGFGTPYAVGQPIVIG